MGPWSKKKKLLFCFCLLKGCVEEKGKLLGGGRFIMCFMTALSGVAGGALTSKTAIVFGFGCHKDGLLAKS